MKQSAIDRLGIKTSEIASIAEVTTPTFAIFIDPNDGEIVTQRVLVWAVINFFSHDDSCLPVESKIRGLTELPETPYLTDNTFWDDGFVGYYRPDDINCSVNMSSDIIMMVRDCKKRKEEEKNERRRKEGREESSAGGISDPTLSGECPPTSKPAFPATTESDFWVQHGVKRPKRPHDERGWHPDD